MTPEEGMRIYSGEYADLIIDYSGDISIFERFHDATVQTIDYFNAVVRVPIKQITNTTILQLGYSVMPTLAGLVSESSLEASGVFKLRNLPNFNLRGNGVLIGIIDTGIDYTNPIFRYADNTTKVAYLWDQTIYGENYQTNTYYGTEYTREQINLALQSDNPFEIVPSKDEIGHGTMLAGIAAGNEVPGYGFFGVVPDAELVIVKLKPAKQYLKDFWKIPADAICYEENDILFALEYLEQVAIRLNRPMSICIALGNSKGAHDSRGLLSNNLTARAENFSFSIVVAAGNEGNARRHYFGIIDPGIGFVKVELNVGENEGGFTMELWGDSPGLFSIDIVSPSGEFVPGISPRLNENKEITFIFEPTRIQIDYQIVEHQSGDQLILLRFTNPTPGIWAFNVFGRGDLSLGFHMWLPMEGFISNSTYFLNPDPNTTILSPGNSIIPITVTAYDPKSNSLYLNASRGYSRTGVIKPDITAPGVAILSPTLDQGFAEVTGTSPATAHAAGIAAMILEWGIVRGNLPIMNTEDVKILMIRGAKRDKSIQYPNRDWGFGILDVYNMYNILRTVL
jgi:subtilisin family serine protease